LRYRGTRIAEGEHLALSRGIERSGFAASRLRRSERPAITPAEEGVDLARQLGYENDEPGYLGLQAWFAALQGREADSGDAEEALRRGLAGGIGWATSEAHLASRCSSWCR
jgi:hypothetical protein